MKFINLRTMLLKKTSGRLFFGLLAALTISACGPTSKIIRDYTPTASTSGLTIDKKASPTLLYTRADAPTLEAYNSFIIDDVVMRTSNPDDKPVAAEDEERVTNYFKTQVISELKDAGYTITDSPGDKTMRISFTLSGLKTPTSAPNIVGFMIPISWTAGGITVEAAFRESSSNRVDAVAINRSKGSAVFNKSFWSTWDDVESSIDQWAKGIRKSVDKAHGK